MNDAFVLKNERYENVMRYDDINTNILNTKYK